MGPGAGVSGSSPPERRASDRRSAEWQPVRYCVETDTMAIELRPWPDRDDDDAIGHDAGDDLVIHYAPDGVPWLWEIEHASRHPEYIAAALAELRARVSE